MPLSTVSTWPKTLPVLQGQSVTQRCGNGTSLDALDRHDQRLGVDTPKVVIHHLRAQARQDVSNPGLSVEREKLGAELASRRLRALYSGICWWESSQRRASQKHRKDSDQGGSENDELELGR